MSVDHLEHRAVLLTQRMIGLSVPLDDDARTLLRDHVCDYVDAMKARGWPPERVIVAVKRIGVEAGMIPSHNITFVEPQNLTPPDKLLVDIVGWCIVEYFRSPRRRVGGAHDATDATR